MKKPDKLQWDADKAPELLIELELRRLVELRVLTLQLAQLIGLLKHSIQGGKPESLIAAEVDAARSAAQDEYREVLAQLYPKYGKWLLQDSSLPFAVRLQEPGNLSFAFSS